MAKPGHKPKPTNTDIQKAIADAIAAANTQQASPIGVPKGFTHTPYTTSPDQEGAFAYASSGALTAASRPKYYDGMQTGAGIKDFPQTTAGIAQLQAALVAAGLLEKQSYTPGQWDSLSSKGYAELLAQANLGGMDWSTALSNRLTAVAKGDLLVNAAKHRQPLVRKVTNPDDIAGLANNLSQSLHGTYLSPDQLAAFTKSYQQQEADFQTQSYEATGYDPLTGQQDTSGMDSNPGGTTLTAPATGEGLKQELSNTIRNSNPAQFEANTFTDRLDEVLSGLRSHISTDVGPLR